MATNRILQLLRSNKTYTSFTAAKEAVEGLPTGHKDGEILLARYISSAEGVTPATYETAIGVYFEAHNRWTVFKSSTELDAKIAELQTELNTTQTAVGLDNNGRYVTPTGTNYLNSTTSVMNALGALDTQVKANADAIDGMDKTASATSGKVLTTVAQNNGLVSETQEYLTDIVMADYSKTNITGAIAATDTLEQAFSKLENAIDAAEVHSNDESITVTADTTGTNIEVNVDGTTIVKNNTTGAISSDLKLAEVTASSTNVEKEYALVYGNSTSPIGSTTIKIYKDSALKEVYLGASTDTIDPSTGVITKNTVTDPQSMNFAYQLADGTYSLTKIDVSKFLTDSEFADGLQVSSGVVSVKKDTTSGKVRIAAVPSGETEGSAGDTGLVDVLTVSSNGVKVDNIQSAINYAVQNASTSLAVSAAGDNVYIDAAVDANNNKKINVTGTYGAFNTPTTANNSLLATPNGIAKAEDVAAAVNTVVGNLDGTADVANAASGYTPSVATGDFQVLTKVVETDGVIQQVGASGGSTSTTLKKVAATGTAADVAVVDSNNKLTATDVEAALEEIVDKADASLNSVSAGNTGITVDSKDGNKNQTISLNISNASDNILGLDATNGGIYLSDTWDCGVY